MQLLRVFAAFVDVASEAFDTYLGVEGVDDSHAGPIDGKRDNLEIGPAERCLQPVEGRHFLPAGPAPGGPEVEQHQLAAQAGEGEQLAAAVRARTEDRRVGKAGVSTYRSCGSLFY